MKILTEEHLSELIKIHGFDNFLRDLIKKLKTDFGRWEEFQKIPRPAMHVDGGVIEVMPVADEQFYTFKYVNCHPKNPDTGQMTVVATGQLARIDSGYPLLFSEMTLLTAFRTAATTALATDVLARKNSKVLAIIGTGAQSEFLVQGIALVRSISEVRYFDTDERAMDKFEKNMKGNKFKLSRAKNTREALFGADIITTCTACKAHVDVIKNGWVKDGMHINGLGGDTVGKTELEFGILDRAKIVVEYFDQAVIEGEIQRYQKREAKQKVHAEMHEIINKKKKGRETDDEITLYDSVGIALEDYSALSLALELSDRYNIGENRNFTPTNQDPKNLISLLDNKNIWNKYHGMNLKKSNYGPAR